MIVYGRNPVREALRGRRAVHAVWATTRAARLDWLAGVDMTVVEEAALSERAGTAEHQGVAARADPYPYADPAALLAAPGPLVVALDQVTDPHNLGAVARTAEAAGATGVIVPAHNAATVTPAVVRASAGAIEHLPVAVVKNLARYLSDVKGPQLWAWAAAGDAETPLWQADLTGGVALVLGAEGKGVRPLVRRTCDATVAIPLAGEVESLNVSVAAGILLYEARRQRNGG